MSDKGYLSKRREEQIAKLLDASIDFDKLLGKKRILGVINLGSFMERNDRKIFESMLSILDDKVIGSNPDEVVVVTIETVFDMLEKHDFAGFADFTANVLSDRITTPFEAVEKQIFLSVLLMFNGLILKAVEAIELKVEQAEAEK